MDKSSLLIILNFFYCEMEDVVKSFCPILPQPEMLCCPKE